ncbi:hypothetical protein [Deinococcus hohokamensis]|uniref:DUF4304 domain-containing protein n=1 Tax=Deinococcus hohokamensis TaxID=309883 RepID=A0ABV9I6K9_9DEIO
MTNERVLLQAFAGRCTGWSYDHVQVDDSVTVASRSTPQGFHTLKLGLTWKRRSWRVHLTATTAFLLPDEDPSEGMGRSTMRFLTHPSMLDPRWPNEWQYLQGTNPEPLVHILGEVYEQTLEPHLRVVSSLTGLVRFMLEDYQPGMFLEPRASWSFDKALKLAQLLEPGAHEGVQVALRARAQALGITPWDNVFKSC